ncbi:MAG TPA: hypothetical protein VMF62_07275 [Acetobacteraceae bacterium]|jgi:hypothetical protein|nr:hypothetical protein [Acetobacteraceae bacterium]
MCDYSLEMYGTRPAREGERYVTTRFRSGTVGLALLQDKETPVCVQCDTRLRLEGIPALLQQKLGVGPTEDVTFVRLEQGPWRDGVKFENGKEASLQELSTDVGVVVTMLLENAPRAWELTPAV